MDTYEKKYKEALSRAKELNAKVEGSIVGKNIEYIFPELAESEDEKIRKEILEYFQQFENEELRGVNISDWIAWLEKQGEQILANSAKTCKDEQKPADKIEPKFKIGDRVIGTVSGMQYYITEV